eukprot:1159636-Pelagomonas_calceolata.AAC.1
MGRCIQQSNVCCTCPGKKQQQAYLATKLQHLRLWIPLHNQSCLPQQIFLWQALLGAFYLLDRLYQFLFICCLVWGGWCFVRPCHAYASKLTSSVIDGVLLLNIKFKGKWQSTHVPVSRRG